MDSQREYIVNIRFFNADGNEEFSAYEMNVRKCLVKTNRFKYIFTATRDCYILDENFGEVFDKKFIEAQIFQVVNDINELKKDERFLIESEEDPDDKIVIKFFKFETSEGNFYVLNIFNKNEPLPEYFVIEPVN